MADPSADTSAPAPVATPQAEAQDILASYGVGTPQEPGQGAPAPGTDPQTPGGPPATPQLLTGKHTVDWGGTPREVDVDSLVKQAMATENAATVKSAADAQIQMLGALKNLATARDTWTPAQQQRFDQIVENPALLDSMGMPAPPPPDDPELDLDARPHRVTPPAAAPPLEQRMDTLAHGMSLLLQREQGRDQADQVQTMEQQIGAKLDSFSVFANNPGARANTMTNVKDHMVLHPEANMDEVVGKHATVIQSVIAQAQGVEQEVQTGGGATVRPIPMPAVDGARVSAQMANGESVHTADILMSRMLDGPR